MTFAVAEDIVLYILIQKAIDGRLTFTEICHMNGAIANNIDDIYRWQAGVSSCIDIYLHVIPPGQCRARGHCLKRQQAREKCGKRPGPRKPPDQQRTIRGPAACARPRPHGRPGLFGEHGGFVLHICGVRGAGKGLHSGHCVGGGVGQARGDVGALTSVIVTHRPAAS